MGSCINMAVISGEVAWVKQKYTKDGKMWVSFAIKQPYVYFDDGKVKESGYDYYFCSLFDDAQREAGRLKEGVYAVVQGEIKAYKDKDGRPALSIVAKKIDTNGLQQS